MPLPQAPLPRTFQGRLLLAFVAVFVVAFGDFVVDSAACFVLCCGDCFLAIDALLPASPLDWRATQCSLAQRKGVKANNEKKSGPPHADEEAYIWSSAAGLGGRKLCP
jgi:hypothetical protein